MPFLVYVLYRLMQHRQNFARLLANADSALTTSRFMRLGLLSGTYILFTVPMSIYQFILQLKVGGEYIPYDWDRIHLGVSATFLLSSCCRSRILTNGLLTVQERRCLLLGLCREGKLRKLSSCDIGLSRLHLLWLQQ